MLMESYHKGYNLKTLQAICMKLATMLVYGIGSLHTKFHQYQLLDRAGISKNVVW